MGLRGAAAGLRGAVAGLRGAVAGLRGALAGLRGTLAGLRGAVVDRGGSIPGARCRRAVGGGGVEGATSGAGGADVRGRWGRRRPKRKRGNG